MEVLRKLDVPFVEQIIAVPEISLDWVPQRSAARRPQTAEQLVEVPTERGYALEIIATKALGWRAAAALAEQLVATPVPQGRRGGQNSTAAGVEQWRSSRFSPSQGSSSSSRLLEDTDDRIQGGFRTFPQPKEVRSLPASRVPECPPVPAHPR